MTCEAGVDYTVGEQQAGALQLLATLKVLVRSIDGIDALNVDGWELVLQGDGVETVEAGSGHCIALSPPCGRLTLAPEVDGVGPGSRGGGLVIWM